MSVFRGDRVVAISRSEPSGCMHRLSAKAAYSRVARDKLVATRSKLNGVNAIVRLAVATGRLKSNGQVERARMAMESKIGEAEKRLVQLQKSGDVDWEVLRDEVESACEDLAQIIQALVARFDKEALRR